MPRKNSGKEQSLPQMGKLSIHKQNNEIDLYHIPHTKNELKQIKDLNVTSEPVLLEGNTKEKLYHIGLGK